MHVDAHFALQLLIYFSLRLQLDIVDHFVSGVTTLKNLDSCAIICDSTMLGLDCGNCHALHCALRCCCTPPVVDFKVLCKALLQMEEVQIFPAPLTVCALQVEACPLSIPLDVSF